MPNAKAFKVTIEVYTKSTATKEIVHEALCKVLHENDVLLMNLHEIESTDVDGDSVEEVAIKV